MPMAMQASKLGFFIKLSSGSRASDVTTRRSSDCGCVDTASSPRLV